MFIDLTPRPTAENSTNPFDRPLFEKAHPLLTPTRANFAQYFNDPDPPTPRTASPTFTRALPSTAISLHAPIFKLMQAPQPKQPDLQAPPAKDRNCALGRLSVHLVSARNLACQSDSAPYAVAQFEQNEWVSGEPQEETDKDRLWKVNHSPVWKQDVSFDVSSHAPTPPLITLTIYDRTHDIHHGGFLGTVQIKPILVHDRTIDDWFPLTAFDDGHDRKVTGEVRVQVTYEAHKTKTPLTPRSFEFLKLIGRGTFGKVFQVRKRDTKRIYAMKVLSKREIVLRKEVAHTIGERKILTLSLESPFLVGLKFSFQTEKDLYLVTDFKSGGELFWHLQRETRFGEERARFYVAELILALEHLHKYHIIYRDLKPENILLDATGHISLCDFGLSKPDISPSQLTTTFCGTTEYLAPEILLDEHGYSSIVDFWSLGVLLFEMCCGWSPFYAEDTQQMYKNICFGKIRFPKGVIREEGKLFVKSLLNRNPKHRLGAQRDAQELKEHPFFAGMDWVRLGRKQVEPPFKPEVESDESTACFDTEFTNADLKDLVDTSEEDEDWLDDEDPSEDWVAAGSLVGSHTPQGPLGSDKPASRNHSRSNSVNGGSLRPLSTNGTDGASSNGAPASNGIAIKSKPKKRSDVSPSSVLSSSVQEKFKGFTFQGGESLGTSSKGVLSSRAAHDEPATTESGATTEDEYEDFNKTAGRYRNASKRGLGFTGLE